MNTKRTALFALCALMALAGCTRVVVTKDPGYDDEGVRYYRPKPYLWIAPAAPPAATKGNDPPSPSGPYVSLSITYLPDYNEEYSIKLNPGLGQGKLELKLADGWNLTSVGIETDQQIDELIGSVAQLASAGASFAAAAPSEDCGESNVPIGLYEAVIATDPTTCRRRLFGWRYVGFAPFTGCDICPMDGANPYSCTQLYGLHMNAQGQLNFGPISENVVTQMPQDSEYAEQGVNVPVPPLTE